MATTNNKEFWENLKCKYEAKNRALKNREVELRNRLDAMEAMMESSNGSCTCPPPGTGGFFKCLMSMFQSAPSRKAKPAAQSRAASPAAGKCDCDPCMYEEPTTDKGEACDCSPCEADAAGGRSDTFSLHSLDIFYMKNIEDLAEQHKRLASNISELEQKANIFEQVFNQYRNAGLGGAGASRPGGFGEQSACPECGDERAGEAQLKLENILLKNQQKEMWLEIRQCIERMEAPMQYKIESERHKSRQLEIELEKTEKALISTKRDFDQAISKAQASICNANTKVYNLTKRNAELEDAMKKAQDQALVSANELVRQKANEADTLRRVQAAFQSQQGGGVKKECSLYGIARELSNILKECNPDNGKHMPDDLKSAAQLLKGLTDLVDQKIKLSESGEVVLQLRGLEPSISDTPIKDEICCAAPSTSIKGAASSIKCTCMPGAQSSPSMAAGSCADPVEQLWPKEVVSERLRMTQQIETKKSKEGMNASTSLKFLKHDKDFPFNVDTQVDYIDNPRNGVHVTTTFTNSGTLEVVTEGPEGMIETTLVYTDSGHVEVVTEMADADGNKKACNRGKFKASLPPGHANKNFALGD